MLTSFDRWAADTVVNGPAIGLMAVSGALGFLVSRWCWHWIDCLTWDVSPFGGSICPACGARRLAKSSVFSQTDSMQSTSTVPNSCDHPQPGRWLLSLTVTALFAAFAWAVGKGECQSLTEGGSIDWIHWRIVYHLCLLTLLITATGIDFRAYLIPDSITLTGVIVGVSAATWFGNLHLIPIWVDANQEVPGIHGPYIPDWIKQHWHWHGLAWSVCGLIAGGGITWLVRVIASWILGREALGFGDVTLMAMIGSFLGWQPILLVFTYAPICGLVMVACAHLVRGKTYIPYGPFLSASTLIVLLTWSWHWRMLRFIFGHPPTISGLVIGAILVLAILLGGVRLFHSIPTKR